MNKNKILLIGSFPGKTHGTDRVWLRGGGTHYKRPYVRGCAANMGSKISLLVYELPFIKCRIWYMNGSIFQNLTKFELKLAQILRKFWKNQVILLKIWSKIGLIGIYIWVHFSWRIGICMGLHSNFAATPPYQNQIWVPSPMVWLFNVISSAWAKWK